MSGIPSGNRAYSLEQAEKMGENCLSLILDARIHKSIPKSVFDLRNLLVLSIQGIGMESLDKDILKLSRLKVLNMMNCGTIDFPKDMEQLPLEALFLSDGKWNKIPEWILDLKKIKSLTISNYKITFISKNINKLTFLNELDLSKNSIKEINTNLSELKIINLSNNKIKNINTELYLSKKIKKINLSYNNFELISEKINSLTQLNYLNLSNNKLKAISINTQKLHLLSFLFLNDNCLEKIPDGLFSNSISELDISSNKIKNISASIKNAKRLRKLNLSKNNIKHLPLKIRKLQQLEVLDFSKNPIHDFPIGILDCNRISTAKGAAPILDASKRKQLIPFIQFAKENDLGFEKREELWSLFINIESNKNRKEAIQLLNSGFSPFKKAAVKKLTQLMPALVKEDLVHVCLAGKFKHNQTTLQEKLFQNNSTTTRQFSKENTHAILGGGKYNFQIDEDWKGVFMSEAALIETLEIKQHTGGKELSLSTIENIKKLLSSKEENQELALRLLENNEIPDSLITLVYFIMVTHENSNIRLRARNILKKKDDRSLLQFSKKDFNKEYLIEGILNKKISNRINKKELAYLLFDNYKKGWKFIYNNYDKNIINEFNQNEIDLSYGNLIQIISELKNIKNANKLNLSNNKITQIKNEEIKILDKFREINLSSNPLKYMPEEILQLDNLRILHLKNCKDLNIEILEKKASWITIFR